MTESNKFSQRRYAKRYVAGDARRSLMTLRVTGKTQNAIAALANEVRIFLSEYFACMVADCLALALRQRRYLPLQESDGTP